MAKPATLQIKLVSTADTGYFYVTKEQFLTPIYMMAQEAIDKVIQFRKVENGSDKKTTR